MTFGLQNELSYSKRMLIYVWRDVGPSTAEKNDIPSNVLNQKNNTTYWKNFLDRQLCFYVRKLFVSEKTQKSELCHFS